MKKVDNIYEQMNKQRDRTPKNQIKTLQITQLTEKKNAFNGLISSRLDMAKKESVSLKIGPKLK